MGNTAGKAKGAAEDVALRYGGGDDTGAAGLAAFVRPATQSHRRSLLGVNTSGLQLFNVETGDRKATRVFLWSGS